MAEAYVIDTPEWTMRNRYEVRGDVTVIYLKQKDGSELECLIDTADLPLVSVCDWRPVHPHKKYPPYAGSYRQRPNGMYFQSTVILMHRLIMQSRNPLQKMIDHRNGNRLDNRGDNLRVATPTLNRLNLNVKLLRGGVYSRGKGFQSEIGYKRKTIQLGSYVTEAEARAARHAASVTLQYIEELSMKSRRKPKSSAA